MEQAQERTPNGSQVGGKLDDLVAKVKVVAQWRTVRQDRGWFL